MTNAFVCVLDRKALKDIFDLSQVTWVGTSAVPMRQGVGVFGRATIQCPGMRSGVLEAGARPRRIAEIGSGYRTNFVTPKRAR